MAVSVGIFVAALVAMATERVYRTKVALLGATLVLLIVPVTDNGQVVGVITRSDFFRALAERFLDET